MEVGECGLGDLPTGCLASILSSLSPRDVAKLALVSQAFLEASKSDIVWKKMLPPHREEVAGEAARSLGALQVYQLLCIGVFIEEDEEDKQQIYWIDRPTGGVCHMLSSRALDITWGDDDRYWDWRSMNGSRFEEVAFLKDVCWLEIRGCFSSYLRRGSYTVAFRLKLLGSHERRRGRGDDWHEDAYGWEDEPVKFTVTTHDGQTSECARYLIPGRRLDPRNQAGLPARLLDDGWIEYDAGRFFVEDENSRIYVEFTMMETTGGNWKSGLYVDGVVNRPSELV